MASGASKFKFISPGIFINEIDESKLPADPAVDPGPTIIGRTRTGPGMRPLVINSFDDFVQTYGGPDPGADTGDNWRSNEFDGPTYGAYAAQAWLVSEQSPVNFVRLLGTEDPLNDGTTSEPSSKAGWITDAAAPTNIASTNGGAYGLFVIDSGSVSGSVPQAGASLTSCLTGALAAVWYLQEGAMVLTGTILGGGAADTTGSAATLMAADANGNFRASIVNTDNTTGSHVCFNFDVTSDKYIRKVFNTNPAQTNTSVISTSSPSYYTYWLGETYDQFLNSLVTGSGEGATQAFIVALESGSIDKAEMNNNYVNAETPWFFGQDLGEASNNTFQEADMQPLFKLVARDLGESAHRYKVSIANLKAAAYPEFDPYGTFSVLLRVAADNDKSPVVIERYDECDLNPLSPNYVAKKIGDRYSTWDPDEGRFRNYGSYPNQSNNVRVVVNSEVEAGGSTISQQLPVGFLGPYRYSGFYVGSGSIELGEFHASGTADVNVAGAGYETLFTGSVAIPLVAYGVGSAESKYILATDVDDTVAQPTEVWAGRYRFPTFLTRASASDAGGNLNTSYFGVRTNKTSTSTAFDESYYDVCRPLPFGTANLSSFDNTAQPSLERGFVFSLDNVISSSDGFGYASGSRQTATSYTATSTNTVRNLFEAGVDKFTAPLHGGFDGLDITERDPFRNSQWSTSDTSKTSYALDALQRAVRTVADPERVVTNLITVPGVWQDQVTDDVISVCENRGDALALIDIEDAGTPPNTEGTALQTPEQRRPSVTGSVTKLRARAINSSYACTYFPWVRVRDPSSNAVLEMPPSVVALGTLASSQAKTELWFAPAGFVRGGLSAGSAGLPVTGLTYQATAKERDTLYAANINPIAQFPNEGIVIFGQKTLQITRSALDRINVRRLMIYVKKEISKMAAGILFDPNNDVTWSRFTSQARPFLASVKARFGLSDFLVVLDKTTTTDDMVDRNIMYAKIFLKPTKAIEFIALDFIITRQGASFND